MNPKIKQQLVQSLRQIGDDNKTFIFLGMTNGKRCLGGILCDMAVEAGVIDAPLPVYDTQLSSPLKNLAYANNCQNTLPRQVKVWAGVTPAEEDQIYYENTYYQFSQIADRIEAGKTLNQPNPNDPTHQTHQSPTQEKLGTPPPR